MHKLFAHKHYHYFPHAGNQIQDLTHARQVCCHWAVSSASQMCMVPHIFSLAFAIFCNISIMIYVIIQNSMDRGTHIDKPIWPLITFLKSPVKIEFSNIEEQDNKTKCFWKHSKSGS